MPLNSQTGFFDFRECLQQNVISTIFSIWLLLKYKRALCYLIEIQDAGFDQHVVWAQRDQRSHQLFRLLSISVMGTFLSNCSYDLHLGQQVFVSNCLSCDQIEIQSKIWGIYCSAHRWHLPFGEPYGCSSSNLPFVPHIQNVLQGILINIGKLRDSFCCHFTNSIISLDPCHHHSCYQLINNHLWHQLF